MSDNSVVMPWCRLIEHFDRLWDLAAGKTMVTLTHHKKSVRAVAIHPTEYSFATGSAGGNNIKKWKCPEGAFVFNFGGHNAIINTLSVNSEGVFFSAGKSLSLHPDVSLNEKSAS